MIPEDSIPVSEFILVFAICCKVIDKSSLTALGPRVETDKPTAEDELELHAERVWNDLSARGLAEVKELQALADSERIRRDTAVENLGDGKWDLEALASQRSQNEDEEKWVEDLRLNAETQNIGDVKRARKFWHARYQAIATFLTLTHRGVAGPWSEVRSLLPERVLNDKDAKPGTVTTAQLGYFHTLLDLAKALGLGDNIEDWGAHFDLSKRGTDLSAAIAECYNKKKSPSEEGIHPTTPQAAFGRAGVWPPRTTLREKLPALLRRACVETGRSLKTRQRIDAN